MLNSGSNSTKGGSLQGVGEAAEARQKQAKKRSVQNIHEHSEPVFNDASATQATLQRSARQTGPPLWLLAELTYRCPLQCPYCSNPLDFAQQGGRPLGRLPALGAARIRHASGHRQARLRGSDPRGLKQWGQWPPRAKPRPRSARQPRRARDLRPTGHPRARSPGRLQRPTRLDRDRHRLL